MLCSLLSITIGMNEKFHKINKQFKIVDTITVVTVYGAVSSRDDDSYDSTS